MNRNALFTNDNGEEGDIFFLQKSMVSGEVKQAYGGGGDFSGFPPKIPCLGEDLLFVFFFAENWLGVKVWGRE